jgi:uncharacterized protein YlxW (UPF0749 family)
MNLFTMIIQRIDLVICGIIYILIFIGKGEDIMPRGVRKSPLVKLRDELKDTQDSIEQYKAAIKTLQEREKQIQEEIKVEQLKDLSTVLEENNMSISELKDLIANSDKSK